MSAYYGPLFCGKLEKAFWKYHKARPDVYHQMVFYARQWKAAGHKKCGVQFLAERVRWEFGLQIRVHAGFKLNNNHCAFYSRLIEEQEADLKGFFRMRKQRIQTSFGPDNSTLPSGQHVH